MNRSTRRGFLATTSAAVAGLAWGLRPEIAHAGAVHELPASIFRSTQTGNSIIDSLSPEIITPADLRRLAAQAIDAARSAGATYADVRIDDHNELLLAPEGFGAPRVELQSRYTFGIRATVGGPPAFVHGSVFTSEAISAAARHAVNIARGHASLSGNRFPFAAAPAVTGEWTTPIAIDPFTVPLVSQVDLLRSLQEAGGQVLGAGVATEITWERSTRVFASTEGSLVTQTHHRARPYIKAVAESTFFPGVEVKPTNFPPCSGGYESLQAPDLPERLKAAAETGAWLSSMPARAFDVGRYPVVFDGFSAGALFSQTLGRALEADRVLGLETDAAGTSFLAPPAEVLGKLVLNPLLNVTGNRAMPSVLATKWDDEGVVPEEFTLLQDGRVIDYCTSRGTASAFGGWYQSQGKPARSHGCGVARTASDPVQVRVPHLHLAAGGETRSLEELYKDIAHGLLVLRCDNVQVDPGINTGMIMFTDYFEINRGKIIGRVRDAAISFNTRNLWKHLSALGDATTMRTCSVGDSKGNPWRHAEQVTTAPAARFENADVISIGRAL